MSGTNQRQPSTSTSSTSRLSSFREMSDANPRPSTPSPAPRTLRIPSSRAMTGANPRPSTSSPVPRIPPSRAMTNANPRPSTSSPVPRIPPSRAVTDANPRPSTSSPAPRIPPSRDVLPSIAAVSLSSMSGLHQALLNKVKMQNKKTYVPNLTYSRTPQPNLSTVQEDKPMVLIEPKKEPGDKENRKGRRERKVLVGTETFAPETKPQITGANLGVKRENIDRSVLKKVFSKNIPKKFEVISSSCSENLPVSAPKSRSLPAPDDSKKMNPLLTDMIRSDGSESPLFLLRLPTHLPYVIKDLECQSKSSVNEDSESQSKSGKTKDSESQSKPSAQDTEKFCSIQDLLAGQIGKLQVLKSGRLRVVLGNCKFWLHRGVPVNFLQELATVKLDNESNTGDIASLGKITGRITMVPDVITNLNYM